MPSQKGFATLVFLIGILLVSGLIIGGTFYLKNKFTQTPEKISQNKIPAEQANTVKSNNIALVYAYNQFSVLNGDYDTLTPIQTKVYRSDINNQDKKETEIGYFYSTRNTDPYNEKKMFFKSTTNGKYLIRYNNKKIEVASRDNLNSFAKIIDSPDGSIHNLTIGSSQDKLVYTIRDDKFEKIYIVNIDGTGQKLIKTSEENYSFSIDAFDSVNNHLYWHNSYSGFVNDGVRGILNPDYSIKKEENYEVNLNLPIFSSDFKKVYYRDQETIIEYDNQSKAKRTLFTPDKNQQNNIIDLMLSPKNDKFVFVNEISSTINNKYNIKRIVYLITLPDGKVQTILDNPQELNLKPVSWSPDGRYIWFDTFFCYPDNPCGHKVGNIYLFDSTINKLNLFFEASNKTDPSQSNKQVKDFIEFIGWLVK